MTGGVRACWTGRAQGDLRPGATGDSTARRRAVVDLPWSWLAQVHGAGVVEVSGSAVEGAEGDALVTGGRGHALAIFTADCAPVALASPEGVMAAVHAGWGGLRAGVVQSAVSAMRRLGASRVEAALGPCIHPECYEFSPVDLAGLESRFGPTVVTRTSWDRPALDIPEAVRCALEQAGAELVFDSGTCTACSPQHWSHRARREPERQALVVWKP